MSNVIHHGNQTLWLIYELPVSCVYLQKHNSTVCISKKLVISLDTPIGFFMWLQDVFY